MTKPIGYKNPPEHTRFKKGQSGNPRGRTKGQPNLKTDLVAELREVIKVNEGGAPRRITKQRALLKAMTARAIGGDGRAATLVLNLILRLLEPQADAPTETRLAGDDEALLEEFLARGRLHKEDQP
jgi:hypothetical protein